MQNQSSISILIDRSQFKLATNVFVVLLGAVFLAALAQVSIPLPWTPVPITGQTFAVAFLSLTWGLKRSISSFLLYISAGAMGAPVFALGKSGLLLGPTLGYLVGMFFASLVMGYLADRGWTKSWSLTLVATYLGSFIIFAFGAFGLSFFIPSSAVLISGVLPFLPGDLVKNLLAATMAWKLRKQIQ